MNKLTNAVKTLPDPHLASTAHRGIAISEEKQCTKAKHLHESTPEYLYDLRGHTTRRPDASEGGLGAVNYGSDEGRNEGSMAKVRPESPSNRQAVRQGMLYTRRTRNGLCDSAA
jgi:hypothetical protein